MIDSPSGRVPKSPPDGISREQKLVAAEFFWVALYWFSDFREFIDAELGQTEQWAPHKALGAPTPRARPGGLSATPSSSDPLPKLLGSLMSRKKIIKMLRGIWTLFDTDILENQKPAKKQLALGTKLIG